MVRNNRLALTLSSPRRIAAGTMSVMMPVDITESGDTVFESRRVSLASTSREYKLGLDYAQPLSDASSLSYVLALRQNADHVAGARDLQAGVIFRTAL